MNYIVLKMNSIIVDFEGYQHGNRFVIKELAIYNISSSLVSNYFFKTPKWFNASSATNDWLIKYHHRIPVTYGYDSFIKVITTINQNHIVFCKGSQKASFLQKLIRIPVVNLEFLNCPRLALLTTPLNLQTCKFENHLENNHCAILKVQKIAEWVKLIEK